MVRGSGLLSRAGHQLGCGAAVRAEEGKGGETRVGRRCMRAASSGPRPGRGAEQAKGKLGLRDKNERGEVFFFLFFSKSFFYFEFPNPSQI